MPLPRSELTPIRSLAVAILLWGGSVAAAQAPAERDQFVDWARRSKLVLHSKPADLTGAMLEPLGRLVGSARIVAMSEAVHVGAEPLELRNRLVEYLVTKKGFTVIALESGVSEGELLYRYVTGGSGSPDSAVRLGMSWTFGDLPQNVELARWIRRYNDDPTHPRKVKLYGFDVPGSPGNPYASRPLGVAIDNALQYLAEVDPAAGSSFRERMLPLRPFIRLDRRLPDTALVYAKMPTADRDRWTAAVADLVAQLERFELDYVQRSSRERYQWGYRHAVGARETDTWLRNLPLGAPPSGPGAALWFKPATESRDRNMAANVEWILGREGADAKLVLYASRYHISAAPVRSPTDSTGNLVVGRYLRARYGSKLVTIGNLIARGAFGCHGSSPVPEATPGSLDGVVATLGGSNLILDLRAAPRGFVDRVVPLGGDNFMELVPRPAFDLVWFIDQVRPAC